MSNNRYKCIVTGIEKYIPPSLLKGKLTKYGSASEFAKHYICPPASKLLRQGQTIDEIRTRLGGEDLPSVDPHILTRLNLLRKKKGLRAKEATEVFERQRYLNSNEFKEKMRRIKYERENMTFQQHVEEMSGGPDGCQRALGGTCHRPDVFLSWNDRACNDCPYFEFCLCDNKRLSHEKKRKKRR